MTELFQKFLLLSLFCAGAGAAALLLLRFLSGLSERAKSNFLFAAILLPFGGALLSPLAKLFPKPSSLPREAAALPPAIREIIAVPAANPTPAIPTAPTANPTPVISPTANPLAAVDWWTVASVLWAAVAVFLLLQMICSHVRLMRSLGRCRKQAQSENRLAVYEVSADISPFLTGIFRGSVYLPENRYSEEERAMALAHEQFHFARGDAFKRIVISVLRCINWLNPPLRIILNRLSDQLEYACDEAVTRSMDREQKRRYGFMLLKTAGFSADRAGFSVGLSRPSKALKRRIGIFMQEKKKFGTAAKALAAAVLSAAAVSVVGISAAAFPPETENTPAAADVPATAGERNEADRESAAVFAPETENTPAAEENKPFEESLLVSADKSVKIFSGTIQQAFDQPGLYSEDIVPIRPLDEETLFALYRPFGLTRRGSDSALIYQGKLVRWFVDGAVSGEGGFATRYTYCNQSGEIDLRTVWEKKDNGGGSYDPFGTLTAIKEFDPSSLLGENKASSVNVITEEASPKTPAIKRRVDIKLSEILAEQACDPLDPDSMETGLSPAREDSYLFFELPYAAEIYSVADGTVVFSEYTIAYGFTVVIKSADGTCWGYAHCSADFPVASLGDTVKAGDVIGHTGTTGQVTGNSLALFLTENIF